MSAKRVHSKLASLSLKVAAESKRIETLRDSLDSVIAVAEEIEFDDARRHAAQEAVRSLRQMSWDLANLASSLDEMLWLMDQASDAFEI